MQHIPFDIYCSFDSFNELKEARVAFQLYEHEDMMGLVVDQHILLRTLKVSLKKDVNVWCKNALLDALNL